MNYLFFDFETRSRTDIRKGTDVYARDAEPTVLCWALDDGPIHTWEIGQRKPERFLNLCHDPETVMVAHNAAFDFSILEHAWGVVVPFERRHCTMAQSYAHSLPGSLEVAGVALGLPHDKAKMADGHKVMMLFCRPNNKGVFPDRNSHPEEWAKYLAYGRQDVEALREIFRRLPTHNYQGEHKRIWEIDQRINRRGFAVDLELAAAAVKVMEKAKRRVDKAVDKLTSGAVTAATQRDRLLQHMVVEDGLLLVDMKASTLREMLDDETLDPASRQLIELRLEGSKNSAAKYKRMLDMAGPDGRLRFTLQFAGADRTGRWAGRGVQPQNLFRPTTSDFQFIEDGIIPAIKSGAVLERMNEIVYGPPSEACANALRSAIMAEPGKELVVADWSNIEGRVLAWLSGENWKLRAFREFDAGTGPDLYKLIYSRSFGKPLDELTKDDRQVGKVQDLACGFGGSVGAFVGFAALYNLDLEELTAKVPGTVSNAIWDKARASYQWALENERDYGLHRDVFTACHCLVQVYRQSHPATVKFWYDLHNAMIRAVTAPGALHRVGRLKVWCHGAWLIVELPSGRRLLYAQPKIKRNKEGREVLTYMNARGKQWRRIHSWHGLTCENSVQAVANDILRAAMLRVDGELPIVLHVHDEIVGEGQGYPLARLIDLMVQGESWSEGLPLAAAGYTAQRYRKD